MIVTVTMNPAVDKTAEVDQLKAGALNRLHDAVSDAGGKGINVSKMIAALGGKSLAIGFAGGAGGGQIRAALDRIGIRHDFVSVDSPTRTNLKLVEANGRVTELNELGICVTGTELNVLLDKLDALASPKTLFVFAGSLPVNVPADLYRRCIEQVHRKGARVFLDADGERFRLALDAKPDFIKPNRDELQQLFSLEHCVEIFELIPLCRRLLDTGIGQMAVSLGAEGALFLRGSSVIRIPGLTVQAHSTVGAGDSMVGALVYAADAGLPYEEGLKLSVAASAGAVTTIGTKAPERALVDQLFMQVRTEVLA